MKHVYMLIVLLTFCFSVVFGQETDKKKKVETKENTLNSVKDINGITAVNDKVTFKDGTTTLIEINSEGTAGSIILPSVGSSLIGTKLYNNGGNLYWGNDQINSAGGAVSAIGDLSDGKTNSTSVYLGSGSGSSLTTGTNNTAFGIKALQLTNEGSFNTAIGVHALINNTQGNNNTAVGASSLFFNLIGNNNTALGYNTLNQNTEGNENVAIGFHGLFKNKTGSHNISLGSWSLYNNLIGSSNIAIGRLALEQNTSNDNIAIGVASNNKNTTGSKNIGIGISTNKHNQEGSNNTIIGHEAGSGSVDHSKSGNIFLGYQAGYNETGSNKLYVENSNIATPLIYGEFDNDLVKINGDFHVTGNISVDNDKSISGLDNLIGFNDLKLYGNSGTVDMYISSAGNIGMGENNPADAKLVVKKGTNVYASKLDGKVIVTDVLEVSGSGIQFNDGDVDDDNIIKKTTKMKYYINVSSGAFPSDVGTNTGTLLGEIKLLPYAPGAQTVGGWLPCEGQEVSITIYPSLFSLMGTTYGGNGLSTFSLPDMRNAIPNHN